MRRKIRLATKIGLAYLFIAILLHANQMELPHYILLGILVLEGSSALLVNGIIVVTILASMVILIKKMRKLYSITTTLFTMLALNSLVNFLAAVFVKNDILALIEEQYSSAALYQGYLINQLLVFCVSILVIAYYKKNRPILKKV